VDDHAAAPLLHHLTLGPLAPEEYTVEVDADDGVPSVDRDLLGLGSKRCAGVVDHDVEATEIPSGALDDSLHLLLDAHVDGHREGPAAEPADRLRHRLEVLELPATDGDVGAGAGEFDRDRFADAGPSARDHGGPAFQGERRLSHGPRRYQIFREAAG